ncbi:MAG: O-antigen ligase family protein [Oscillospiraceae bacterium]
MTSNFIVDMKLKTFHRIILFYFLAFFAVMTFTCVRYYYDELSIYDSAYALSFFGYGGLLIFLISYLKKDVEIKKNTSYILLLGFFLLTGLSVAFAVDRFTAVYGNKGRYEGFLSIIGYTGLFLAASVLYVEKYKKVILDIFVGFGFFQAVLGILQSIPALDKYIPSYFSAFRFNTEAFIANGITGSPVFLSALLTMLCAVSLSGAIYDGSKARRILYAFVTTVSVICAFLTDVIQAIIGISAAFITIGIIEIVRIKKGHTLLKGKILSNSLGRFSLLLLSGAIVTAVMIPLGEAKLQDKSVIFEDSFYRAYVTGDQDAFDDGNIYLHMMGEGIEILKDKPFFGTGPDCITRELYTTSDETDEQSFLMLPNGSIDRPYNEYLYIAMSRGIPCLLVYLALLFFTLKKGFSRVGGFYKRTDSWTGAAFTAAVTAYLVQAFLGMSAVTVTPFFWIMLGFILSKKESEGS